ncbi:MAG TPA: MMPL family transporter, partial [Candidatus Ozemobacteraceae bacterium]|nr:MMPL family transporter [Candidatus Ozemobacteraceae bacterium]
MSEAQQHAPPKGFFLHAARFLVTWRRSLFFGMVLLVICSLFFVKNIKIDNSLEVWFLEGDPTLTGYREFKKQYGNDEVIVAVIDCEKQGGVFSHEMLARLYKTSKDLEADTANFKRIVSVGVAPYIGLQGQDLIVEDLIATTPTRLEEAETIKKRFFENPLWKKLLLEPSERYAIFIIEPIASDDMDKKRPEIIAAARKHLQTYAYKLAGMGVMYDELNRLSLRDGAIFSSVSYVIIAVLIYALYRSWVFFSIVVTVMLLGGASFMGIFGLFEQNFNMVTIVLPTLMMILSISDVTYIINIYCFRIDKVVKDREEGLIEVFADCLSPCLFTSITNGMGFFSIMASPMEVLRGFGLLAGISCFLEYFVSVIAAAYILGRLIPDPQMRLQRPFEGWMDGWVKMVPKYNRLVMLLLIATTGTGLYGISLLQVDTYSMGFLHESNPVRRDSDAIESTYGNYLPLEVRLITGKDDGVKDPAFLKRLEKAHTTLESIAGVERAASIIDVICRLNQVWTDGASSSYRVPDEFNQVSQLLMMYESDPDNDLEHMVNRSYAEARLTVRLRMVSASWLRAYEEKVRVALEQL